MKSTKAMDVGHGLVIQTTTQQRGDNGSYAVADALVYVPGVMLREHKNEEGIVTRRKIIPRK